MNPIPETLHGRPFTTAEAYTAGVTDSMLYGQRFARIFRGVYRTTETMPDFPFLLQAALLLLPPHSAVSHLTCLRLFGFAAGPLFPLHFSTNQPHRAPASGIVVHRRQAPLHTRTTSDFTTLGPMRTFVDVATQLGDRALLRVGDWMLMRKLFRLDELRQYVGDSHLNGVQRARRVAHLMRLGVASPRESDVRWEVVKAGLPEPELNAEIFDDHGHWLARGDLVFRAWKLLVEYDGRQHVLDPRQVQWDHLRREALEAAGWRLIIVTSEDMTRPRLVVLRIRQALVMRGYRQVHAS